METLKQDVQGVVYQEMMSQQLVIDRRDSDTNLTNVQESQLVESASSPEAKQPVTSQTQDGQLGFYLDKIEKLN